MARLFKKKSVIWKWIISYFCIVIVTAVSSLITYDKSQRIIKERQERINEVVLEQASKQIQNCLIMMENLKDEILTNTSYTSLSKSDLSRSAPTAYKQYMLYKDLNTYIKLNKSYSHIILYFENGDKIISDSSVNFSKAYWDVYKSSLGLSFDEWNDLINGTYNKIQARNVKIGNSESTIFSRTIQSEQVGRKKVNLFVIFTKEDWERVLGEYGYYKDTSMLILDQSGNTAVMFDDASIVANDDEEQIIIDAIRAGEAEVTVKNKEVIKLNYLKKDSPVLICILTPESVYLETIQNFQLIFRFIFLISLGFSLVLIVIFVKDNYEPVRDLLKILRTSGIFQSQEQKDENLLEDENEFTIVKEGMTQVSNSYQNVKMALNRQNKMLREVYLARLLHGKAKLMSDKQLQELYGLEFKYPNYAVILLYVQDFDFEQENNTNNESDNNTAEIVDLEHAQQVILDKYNEYISDTGWTVNHTKIDDILVLIVCFPEEENCMSLLNSILEEGMQSIETSYNMEYLVSVSAVHSNLEQISVAYQEALQAFEALRLYDLGNMVHYSDIYDLFSTSYNYPYEMEQRLMKAIQLGNFTNAKAIFSEIIESNINSKKYVSHDIIRCLLFDILGTVMKTFDTKPESQKFIKQLKPAKRLSECSDIQSMKEAFEDILLNCCEYFKAGSNKDENLCYQIQAYIRENYSDPNLSIASIAEYFSMSPVALSKVFREVTGTKIAVAISEIRVQEAKRLLLSSDENLSSIANKIGFGSTKTFTRTFKQLEGCTPGQWRDSRKSED